jgi:hypothetical protein
LGVSNKEGFEMVEVTLESLKATEEQLELEALERLDAGENPMDVLISLYSLAHAKGIAEQETSRKLAYLQGVRAGLAEARLTIEKALNDND